MIQQPATVAQDTMQESYLGAMGERLEKGRSDTREGPRACMNLSWPVHIIFKKTVDIYYSKYLNISINTRKNI